jgi:TetR/AcrR family transcriptional repressor of nem operon
MPYPPEHKPQVRAEIIMTAKELFTFQGYEKVTIDMITNKAGLTRGVFYSYFKSKEDLFIETITFGLALGKNRKTWEEYEDSSRNIPEAIVKAYLSDEHLNAASGGCPLFSFPTDTARGSEKLQGAYTLAAKTIAKRLESEMEGDNKFERSQLILSTMVGAMVLSRATQDPEYSTELRENCIKYMTLS